MSINNITISKIFLTSMIFFLLGISASNYFPYDESIKIILFSSIVLIFIVLAMLYTNKIIITFSLAVILFFIGIIYYHYYENKHLPNDLPYDSEVAIKGIVSGEPDVRDNKIKLTINIVSSEKYKQLENVKILVNVPRYPEYNYGDEVELIGILDKPKNFQVGNNYFDYEKYLVKDNIYAITDLTKSNCENIKVISHNNGSKIFSAIYQIKNAFSNSLNIILPSPDSGLMEGLLLGTKNALPKDLMEIFTIVGLVHIIAVSGYNVTIVVKFFENATILWSRNLVFWIGILGLIGFVILTGAQSSVIRAALMASMFLMARQLGRKGNLVISVTLVACVMVLFNPFILIYDIGFQLSFMAVIGLIYVAPIMGVILNKLNNIIKESLVTTLGAQITTIPIILYYFGRLSIIAPLANIVVLPIIPITMFFGFISGLLGLIIPKFASYISVVPWLCTEYIIRISEYISKIKYASIELNFHNFLWVIMYYLTLYILYIFISRKIKKPSYK